MKTRLQPPPLHSEMVNEGRLCTNAWAAFFRVRGPVWLAGTHTERAGYDAATLAPGSTFLETDRGVTYYADVDGVWKYQSGTMRDTLADLPAGLGTEDTGFLFYATDYWRLWRWTGSAWVYADGQREAKEIIWYPGTLPDGWELCDGSAVTVTKADATTESFTTPDLVGRYPKGGVYTGANGAAVTPGLTGQTGTEPDHVHSIEHDHAAVNTGAPSATTAAAGAGTAASSTHTHSVDLPNYTGDSGLAGEHFHDAGTLALDGTAEPEHVLLLPIVKL